MRTDETKGHAEAADRVQTRHAGVEERAAFQGEVPRADGADPGPQPRPSRTVRAADLRTWFSRMLAEERRFGTVFLWLPVAAAIGVTVEISAPRPIPLMAIAGPLGLTCALALAGRLRGRGFAWPALVVVAFFAGMAASALQIAGNDTVLLDGPVVTHVRGAVLSSESDGRGGWRYRVRLASTSDPVIRRPPVIVQLLARARHRPIDAGGGIAGLARLSPMSGPALPGEYDFGFNAFFDHTGAIGFFYGAPKPDDKARAADDGGLVGSLALSVERLRTGIGRRVRAVLPGEEGALATALIVAKRRAIPKQTVAALRNSGLAHILAISGLHMALVAGTLFFALRMLLGLSPRLVEGFAVKKFAAGAALLVATAYLVLSGGAVSTVRAWVMLSIMLVAVMLDRPAMTMRNVAIAAVVVMATDPAAVVGPSFQMSFAATAALVAGYALFRQRNQRREPVRTGHFGLPLAVARLAAGIAFTSLIAGSATAMFAAYHFHRVAAFGLLGNLLAMPVITFVVMPFGLASVLLMPYGLEAMPLRVMGTGLHLVIAIAEHVSALGGSFVPGRIPVAALLLFVAGFCVLVLMRSRLRLIGLAPVLASLAAPHVMTSAWKPLVLISEDGKLVGLPGHDGIATNRSRPSAFVFDQWQAALDRTGGARPRFDHTVAIAAPAGKDDKQRYADGAVVAAMRRQLAGDRTPGLVCVRKVWCGGRAANGTIVVWVEDLAYLGAACDIGGIVVTPAAVHMSRCRSDALLFTGATLRRSGAVEIDARAPPAQRSRPEPKPPDPSAAVETPAAGGRASKTQTIRVRTAVGGVLRRWSVQRYYDWRSRSFDFDRLAKPARILVIPAD